jgi:hypothetical protein
VIVHYSRSPAKVLAAHEHPPTRSRQQARVRHRKPAGAGRQRGKVAHMLVGALGSASTTGSSSPRIGKPFTKKSFGNFFRDAYAARVKT